VVKLRVGCDKDNVLARCAERFCEILEDKYGIYLPLGEVTHYFFQENHPDIDEDMVEEIIRKYLIGEEQINMIPIREGIDCLSSLKDKISLWIITDTFKYGTEQEDVEAWCEKNGVTGTVIIAGDKDRWVKELELDFMIEDRGDTALKIARKCPSSRVLLLNRPWNRHVDTKAFPNLLRCNDWYDINRVLLRALK
jgi:uncharacterized HAD superfamily protein